MELVLVIIGSLIFAWAIVNLIYIGRHVHANRKYQPLYNAAFDATFKAWRTEMQGSYGDISAMKQSIADFAKRSKAVDDWCDKARNSFFTFNASFLAPFRTFGRPIYTQEQIDAFSIPYLGEEWAEIITEKVQ